MTQKTISIFNPMQNASKTTTAYLLANALANAALLDLEDGNNRKKSKHYYDLRPGLPKPFGCYDASGWKAEDKGVKEVFDFVVVDTQKSPSNGIVSIVGKQSDLVVIPSPPNAGAWSEGVEPALKMLSEIKGKIVIVLSNTAGEDTSQFEALAAGANIPVIAELPQMDIEDCVNKGWLPQYRSASQHRWAAMENNFKSLAFAVSEMAND